MTEASTSIGERLRLLRRDRGHTQEELAEISGVSKDLIAKLEQGRRETARITTLSKLADALDVEISELVDKRERLGADRDGGSVLALRDVLLSPELLPGLDLDDSGEPTPPDQLMHSVRKAWHRYWVGDFGDVLATLPGLIGEARLAHSVLGAAAAEPLTSAYDLASSLMTQIGRTDLGAIAAERAITVAHSSDDRLMWAIMYASYSWVLLHQGRFAEAERVTASMAEQVEPSFHDGDLEIAVWGNLMLTAIAPTVAQERDPDEYLRMASAAAERLREPVRPYQHAVFAPSTVAMQATYGYSVLKQPGKALTAAKRIQRGDLSGISRGAHLMDVAQAHFDAGHHGTAATTLLDACRVSPVWFRHQRIARSVTVSLREAETRLSAPTRTLVKVLDLAS
jgi:transcriptional regulator with XRE-family HTH domain